MDLDDRSKELEIGLTGEICVRGPQIMLGYHKNPKATTDMIDKDGWLYTGIHIYNNTYIWTPRNSKYTFATPLIINIKRSAYHSFLKPKLQVYCIDTYYSIIDKQMLIRDPSNAKWSLGYGLISTSVFE